MSLAGARVAAVALMACATLALGACSDEGDSADTTDAAAPEQADCTAETPELRVDLVDEAVAAVEEERGGEQRYYEINATTRLVNLFVAGEAEGEVVPYVFVDGALSSQPPQTGAAGSTFPAASLGFDPMLVTSCVRRELPDASLVAFEVLGGEGDVVQYSVIATSRAGGQLIVLVAPDGRILSADPV